MARQIHSTAVVDPKAELADDVEIGAYAVVGPDVTLGPGSKVWHHASVWGYTTIGSQCQIYPFASIGMQTQDLKYKGGKPGTRIGDRNVFREYVSINAATNEGDYTVIGNDNYFLAYCHVGHCCKIGNHLVASNGATFAGHVVVEDHVGMGGNAGVHQFCQLGAYSFVGGCAKVVQDVPPYMLADGLPAKIHMFNKTGLERSGFTPERMATVKSLFKTFYREGKNRQQAIAAVKESAFADTAEAQHFIRFVEASERGLAPGTK